MNHIFYHSGDLDGWCSGAIIKQAAIKNGRDYKMHPINYGEKFPWNEIEENDIVYMADFSLQPFEEMVELEDKVPYSFFWFDHHKSAIDNYNKNKTEFHHPLYGDRNPNMAACEIVYKFFFCGQHVPLQVKLLSLYDTWNHSSPDANWDLIESFQEGTKLYAMDPSKNDYGFWDDFLEDKGVIVGKYTQVGENIVKYKNKTNDAIIKNLCFINSWEGYSCLIVNDKNCTNQISRHLMVEDCDIGITYYNVRNHYYVVSLRSEKVDVSEIAKKYGGGGHRGAAGFQCDKLPWEE